jgi:alkylation response protein AidB-like acyl-CoA dehydrogenase
VPSASSTGTPRVTGGSSVGVPRLSGSGTGLPRIDLPLQPAWRRLHPLGAWEDPTLAALAAEVERPETQAELTRLEDAGEYPHGVFERLYHLGLASILVEPDGLEPARSIMTSYHLYALNAILGRLSGSLAITVGVNFHALLPVWIAGSQTQLRRVSRRITQGAFVSMAITEIDRGSDVLRNQTRAIQGQLDEHGGFVPSTQPGAPFTHYRVSGEKQLINGATFHDLMITFVRTKDGGGEGQLAELRNFSFFIIPRDPTLERPRRWLTLPAQAADIASVRFNDTIVSKENLLGREGSGVELLQRTLSLSRGSVSAIAAGTTARARELAVAYARERRLNDVPIGRLGPVAEHLLQMDALDMLTAAMSNKACAMANALGFGAAHYTAVAKFACSTLAEEAVRHGGRVLSARALLREHPYERLLRDVLLYGIFEGTTHVMLDRIQARLAQVAVGEVAASPLDQLAEIYGTPPRRLLDVCRHPAARQYLVSPESAARQLADVDGLVPLAPLVQLSAALLELVRTLRSDGRWSQENGLRFEAAEVFAYLECLLALIEQADPGRRAALGMPPLRTPGPAHDDSYRFAVAEMGGRLTRTLRALTVRTGVRPPRPLEETESAFLTDHEAIRARMRAHVA